MRKALIFKLTAWILLICTPFLVAAESADSSAAMKEGQAWLKRIQSGAQKLNYSGTFVYQQAEQMRTSRITHLVDGKNEIEKLEILDGKPREYIRRNEEVSCYLPETKTIVTEKRIAPDVFPAIFASNTAEMAEHYNVKKAETGRVAGFECQAILLEPKDHFRYGYKLWAEKTSGLLLRAQTLNDKNEVVEQIAFTQLSIGDVDKSRVKSSFANTGGWRIENATMTQVAIPDWIIKWVPPGFKKIREMRRLVQDAASNNSTSAGAHLAPREISQIVFSDGLAAISVFIEPGTQSRTEGTRQQGAMNIVGKRHGDFWLTIVGEVPAAAVKKVANSIEHKPE